MEIQDPFKALDSTAIELHEIFISYKNAGFTSDEALTLVGILLSND
jgi:hypothetical protein